MSISTRNADKTFKIERSLLKDQIVDLLREKILIGKIPQGTRLIERDIADILQVSRVPVRDAMLVLEGEGLLEAAGSGRRVITLSEEDMIQLNRVRVPLEKLATRLFIENATQKDFDQLDQLYQQMSLANSKHSLKDFIECDINIHKYIWENTENHHLQKILESIIGPMAMTVSTNDFQFDWEKTLELHEDLIRSIKARDVETAEAKVIAHLQDSLERTLLRFHIPRQPEPNHPTELAAAILNE